MIKKVHRYLMMILIFFNLSCTNAEDSFYGEWIVCEEIARNYICALSDEDIKDIFGIKVIYNSDFVKFGSHVCSNPKYERDNVSEVDFFEENWMYFTSLGIESDFVETVTVFENGKEIWNNPGGFIIVKNKDTLIIPWDGVYFKLIRK